MTFLKDQAHMTTHRGADKRILKTAKDEIGRQHISNESMFLGMMATSGYVPKVVGYLGSEQGVTSIFLEDLGDTQPVTDTDALLTHATHLLGHLHQRGIWHGDLTAPNIIIRDDKPHAIDFAESRFLDAAKMNVIPKRPEPDWFHLLQAMEHHGDPRRIIRRWLAIRESLGTASLEGKTVVDFGCHEGYMVALASADGANTIGWDIDQITCAKARDRWVDMPKSKRQFPLMFLHLDIDQVRRQVFRKRLDVSLLLSTYPYMIEQLTEEKARLVLARIVQLSDVVFFEAQSSGDGSGPAFWKDQAAVGEYLTVFGNVEEVCRLKIAGRDAERVTWKITKEMP